MTINSLQLNTSTPFTGLATQTFNVVTAGLYTVGVTATIPYIAPGSSDTSTTAATDPAASALSIVVNLNGSAKMTLNSPTPTQPSMGGSVRIQCAAADVITVVTSSANASDAVPNAVKGIINVFAGE